MIIICNRYKLFPRSCLINNTNFVNITSVINILAYDMLLIIISQTAVSESLQRNVWTDIEKVDGEWLTSDGETIGQDSW